jgi:hypothetical protein
MFTRSFYARPGSPRHGRARIVKPQNKMSHHVSPLRREKHAPPRIVKITADLPKIISWGKQTVPYSPLWPNLRS